MRAGRRIRGCFGRARLRAFANLTRVFPKATFAQVWDNSGTEPKLLFEKRSETTEMFDADAIPEVTTAVKAASR